MEITNESEQPYVHKYIVLQMLSLSWVAPDAKVYVTESGNNRLVHYREVLP